MDVLSKNLDLAPYLNAGPPAQVPAGGPAALAALAAQNPAAVGGVSPQALAPRVRPDDRKDTNSVATGFESMFWSVLMKQMRETLEPEVLLGPDSGDVLGGMFDLYLGQHLAQSHALGIAALVKRQLEQTPTHEHPHPLPPPHGGVGGHSRSHAVQPVPGAP